jgi:hypothetical protein
MYKQSTFRSFVRSQFQFMIRGTEISFSFRTKEMVRRISLLPSEHVMVVSVSNIPLGDSVVSVVLVFLMLLFFDGKEQVCVCS